MGIEIVVKDSLEKHFVNEADIVSILKKSSLNPKGKKMSEINTHKIEMTLLKNEMIKTVDVYKTPSAKIKMNIIQKRPILRVLGNSDSYYIDNQGDFMPISYRYAVHVPIVTGYAEKEFVKEELYKFALFLQKDDFWNNQIDQIYIRADKEVELVPRVGQFHIILGEIDGFEDKLQNLKIFYKQAIPVMGWNKYKTVNLKFKNQIVCTHK
jgi:cell division protein FtsQ